MQHLDGPGRYHKATQVGEAYHVRPTDEFARRDWLTPGCAIFAIIVAVTFAAAYGWKSFTWPLIFVGVLALIWTGLRPPPARMPLVLTKDGRIEYQGKELRPRGPVTSVRVFTQSDDHSISYHIEVLSGRRAVELPDPDFGNASDLAEVVVLAAWLAQVWEAPLAEEIGDGPTSV